MLKVKHCCKQNDLVIGSIFPTQRPPIVLNTFYMRDYGIFKMKDLEFALKGTRLKEARERRTENKKKLSL